MRRLSLGPASGDLRARRWDVLVLGGALPGLAAAVRLGMAGLRVAVIEEDAVTRTEPLLREPFSLTANRSGGVMHGALRALGVPLIEQRSLAPEEIAHQVLLPETRVDVGAAALTGDELVAWGLAKPELARELVESLIAASEAEREAMLAGSIVRARRGLGTSRTPRRLRGLPALAGDPSPGLAPLLAAQLVALSNLGTAMPPPEAAARLLGSALEGGAHFDRRGLSLRGLLRQRVEALHGEFRSVTTPFELVEVGGHPGIARRGASEAWLGRLMLLNTPAARLAAALEAWQYPVPGFLDRTAPSRRRAAVHYRIAHEALPEALARRAILVPEAGPGACVTLVLNSGESRETAEIVAATRVADEAAALEPGAEAIEAALRALLPFGVESMVRLAAATRPVWDDELALVDPPAGRGWPAEVETRCSSRPLVHALAREQVAALGVEGDLLLGWHAGDALTAELA